MDVGLVMASLGARFSVLSWHTTTINQSTTLIIDHINIVP